MNKVNKCTTCCPRCSEESFEMIITASGTSFDGERITHWFEGEGKCLNVICGYEGWLSDSD